MKVNRIVPVNILRPVNISEFNWKVYCEYQSGVFKFEIARKNYITLEQVSDIIEGVMSALRDRSAVVYQAQEFTSWQSAESYRELIREKFIKAPVINGRKTIMSEL